MGRFIGLDYRGKANHSLIFHCGTVRIRSSCLIRVGSEYPVRRIDRTKHKGHQISRATYLWPKSLRLQTSIYYSKYIEINTLQVAAIAALRGGRQRLLIQNTLIMLFSDRDPIFGVWDVGV